MEEEANKLTRSTPRVCCDKKDPISLVLGNFGYWQFKISLLMALMKLPIAWFQMSIVFLAPTTKFWCKKPESSLNITDDTWKNMTEPSSSLIQKGLNEGYCYVKNMDQLDIVNQTERVPCLNGFDYNRSDFLSTIITEWDLVCDRQKFVDVSQMTLMWGVLLGNLLFGVLADKKGRKTILIWCIFLQSLLGILASISPYLWLFITLRLFLGLANGGTMVTSFVMCMEVVEGKWRNIIPILYQIPFGFGNTLMSIIAYYYREWRTFHMIISVLSFGFIILIWLIPESPRWLMVVGKRQQAIKVLKYAAEENKNRITNIHEVTEQYSTSKTNISNGKVKELFSTKELRKITTLLCINWSIAGLTFYAFTQYIGYLGKNLFLNVALGGLITLPGTIICIFLLSNYGRRYTISFAYVLTGLCFLLIIVFPKGNYPMDWPRILFAGLGIIGLSVSLPAMYLFTSELFPTALRNSGLGFAMMFSRLASMFAPLVISLQDVAAYLPLLMLALAAFIQALVILPLPETGRSTLPDDLEDAEKEIKNMEMEN